MLEHAPTPLAANVTPPRAVAVQKPAPSMDEFRNALQGRLPREGAVMLLARVSSDQAIRNQVEANISAGAWPEFAIEERKVGECGMRPMPRLHVVRVGKGGDGAVSAERPAAAVRAGRADPAREAAAPAAVLGEPGPAAGPAAGRPVAVDQGGPRRRHGQYTAFRERAATLRPGEMLEWPDNRTDQISSYASIWGKRFGIKLGQHTENGRVYIKRKDGVPTEATRSASRKASSTTPKSTSSTSSAPTTSTTTPTTPTTPPAPVTPAVDSAWVDAAIRAATIARDAKVQGVNEAFDWVIAELRKLNGVGTP